jgi:hypothetical protein
MGESEMDSQLLLEHKARPHDVDAAHARLRSHQASLDYINSRVDGNERRIDRIEKRMDDQSALMNELSVIARSTQAEVRNNGETSRHTSGRVDQIAKRLEDHTTEEIKAQHAQTVQLERLHRTIIRGVTVLAVIAALLIVLTRDSNLLQVLLGAIGG